VVLTPPANQPRMPKATGVIMHASHKQIGFTCHPHSVQVARIRQEEHLVNVYGADGWRGARCAHVCACVCGGCVYMCTRIYGLYENDCVEQISIEAQLF
jgi:UDP-N-acetylenolpyruvoylglucosamine reductase